MGLFDALGKALEDGFGKIDATFDQGFGELFSQLEEAGEAEQELYGITDRVVEEYRALFGRHELALLEEYEQLGEILDTIPTESGRYGRTLEKRASMRNELLRAVAQNEAVPARQRTELSERIEGLIAVTNRAAESANNALGMFSSSDDLRGPQIR